ncbi:MAG: T9SS type A sorting domain-containing protein [Bacteroidales bacterium]
MYLQKKYFQKVVSELNRKLILRATIFLCLILVVLSVQVYSACSLQLVPTITGPVAVCTGVPGNVYFTEPGMTDYNWSVSAGGVITSGAGTNSITVTWNVPGSETVSVIYAMASQPASLNITVSDDLPAGLTIAASANPVCAGNTVVYNAYAVNGGSSPVYQWKVNGINLGNNNSAFSYIPSNGDLVGCQMTSSLPCVSGNPVAAVPIVMTVNQNQPAIVSISASSNPVCSGTQVNFSAIPVNGGTTPVYQWKVNGNNAGTNNQAFIFTPVNGDVVVCQMTSSEQCISGSPANSNPVTMSVSPNQPVGVSVTASANPSCSGVPVTFTAVAVNGGMSPVYQWIVNGNNTGATNSSYAYTPANGDQVSCQLTSNASCATGNPAISNVISMAISPGQPVSVSIAASLNPVCQGNPVTFNALPVNGGSSPAFQWSINGFNIGSNSPVFTYTPANGDVVSCQLISSSACATGNPAVSAPVIMIVNPVLPVNITISGSSNPVCTGAAVTYTATPYNGGSSPAYQWKVNGLNSGTNNAVYSYVPVNGDIVTCSLFSNAACTSGNNANSNSITMTVSPNQLVGVSIVAATSTVCQGMTADLTATPVNGGSSPIYQWKVNGVNAGNNNAFFSFVPLDGDVVTCLMTSSAVCTTGNPAMSNPVAITVTQGQTLPVSVYITATANPSCLGQSITYTATPVNGGSSPVYQWLVNGLNVGTNSPTFSYIPSNGDFIKCQLTSSYLCATGNPAISGQISMTVNPVLAPAISIVGSANPSCLGTLVTYTATAVNTGTSPIYQWRVNGLNSGVNQPAFSYTPVNGDIVSCQLTSSVPCPLTNPVVSNSVTMSVLPVQSVSVSIATATNPSCQFTQVTFIATPVNGGTSPVYQWKVNGGNVGANNPTFIYIPVGGDVVTCQLTSNALCYLGNRTVVSNSITMTTNSELPASVSITSSLNPFCQGLPVTFTATPVNGGNTPAYQWKVNCANVGTNSSTLSYAPVSGDFVTCQMTSSLSCAVMNPAISNGITMTANTSTPAGVSVSASANPVCTSSPVTYTAVPVNGGLAPVYQWKVNGVVAGTNSPVYNYSPSNGDLVTCRLSSNATCVSGNPVTSAPVNMVVSAALPASIGISTLTNPFCLGAPVTFTATPVNGGTLPMYQWQVNGVNAGVPSATPTFTAPSANGDVVQCMLTSNASCITGPNPVTSNLVTLSSAATLPAGITISASANPVCQGTGVTFTATPVNGGENPVYQWTVNGVSAGTNSSQYIYSPANGDQVACQLTSGLGCATSNPATSNVISMTVNPVLPVSVSITATANPCCFGTVVTFNATPVNGGGAPVYQWKVNCLNVGSNSSTFTYTPVNGDVVVCVLTSNALCSSGNPAISNNINMVVLPLMPASVTISTLVNPFCIGTSVTFTALPINEGSAPVYQWKVNGANAGTNSTTFIYQPSNGDVVTCVLTSSLSCVSGSPATSEPIIMIGNSGLPVSVQIISNWNNNNNTICQGTLVFYTATPTNGGNSPSYQWKVNGVNKGTNHTYEYSPANGDVVTCVVTSSLNCASSNPATSNAITMTVFPNLPLSVSILASANPSCLGSAVTYNATAVNGGTNPTYRWRVNGVNSGTNTSTFSYTPVNNDVVLCRVTSNEMCATNNPSNSNSITMVVSPTAPASVSIAASANPVCQGTMVTYTATPFNGGSLPVYQWKVNGVNAGTNSVSFVYAPVNGDVVSCQMTSNSPCIAITQVTSNTILMTVSQIQPVSISIAASSNPTCIGSSVTYTATGLNGGTSPVYQWKVNGTVVGGNSISYTYIPVNGDVVTCKLTSNAACGTGNPANSNTISMTVSESLAVGISIAGESNTSCQGQQVNYTAAAVNGGVNPVYQWRINGIDVGTNSPGFTYTPSNGDFITCQLTSSFSCGTGNPALSNQVSAVVYPIAPVSLSIISSANPVCQETPVTYTASAVNGGTSPLYQWRVNGVNAGLNIPGFTYTAVNGDVVDCQLTSNISCPLNNPAGCTPITMTVLPPAAAGISIAPSVNPICPGTSVTFASVITNGGYSPQLQWMVNGVVVANNIEYYTYIPVDGDLVTCQLNSTAMCVTGAVVTSNTVVMSVNANLVVGISITSSANPSCQGQTVSYTATGVNGGVTPVYQWLVNGINVGANSPVFSYTPTNGDIVSCQLLSDMTCVSGNPAVSNQVLMDVSQSLPLSLAISVSSNPVCLGSLANFTAIPVNGGSSPVYQWKVNGVNSGINLPFFSFVPANGDIVTCQVTSAHDCTLGQVAVSNPVVMVVSTDLTVNATITATSNPVCQGTLATFSVAVTNGGNSPIYQWRVNGLNSGNNAASFSYIPSDGDVVTCLLTSDLPCASGNPATSNPVVMSVYSGQAAGVSIVANPSGVICEGNMVTFTAIPVNGGSPFFQWYRNGVPVGSNQPVYTYSPLDGDMIQVVMTSGLLCVSGSPATSNILTMVVNPALPASVTIVSDQTRVCEGMPVTFTSLAVNGGTPAYQWLVNGSPAGTNQSTFTYNPVNGDQVSLEMTSGLACVSGNPALSNTISMIVDPNLLAEVTIVADQNNTCEGTPVTLTASVANGGVALFQWFRNNLPVGLNQSTYGYTPSNGDQVYVVVTSSLACITGSPATSNTVTFIVNPVVSASVSITADQNNVCEGTAVVLSATAVNGGIPSFQWFRNSSPVGLNQSTYTFIPIDGDMVYVVMNSGLPCVSGTPVTSNIVTLFVNAPLPASVSIVSDQNNVCQGSAVSFTASGINDGTASYQWRVNGILSGSNQPIFTYNPVNGDQVNVVMTSGLSCVSGSPATSNTITMVVNPILPVSVSVTVNQNNVCEGTPVTFTAVVLNGGTPGFQWYKNSLPVGLNQSSYSYTPLNGDLVNVVVTSSLTCIIGSPAMSNPVSMLVNPVMPAGVSVAASQNGICQGTSVTFSATPSNGGTPVYQWYKNGLPVGLNQPAYTYIPSDGDQVYVVMNSTLQCTSGSPATSNIVTMMVNTPLPASVSIVTDQNNICEGTSVTFTATAVNGGSASYQWLVNGIPAGSSQPTFSYVPASGDVVKVVMTSGLSCVSGSPATSNAITMLVNPILPVSVSIVVNQNSVCQGTPVTLTANVVNGGVPGFQWYKNSLPVGLNQPTYAYTPANGDVVNVVVNSSLNCITGSPATSNSIVMIVNPVVPVSVSISADQNNICQGTMVIFTATPTNGGTPVCQWYKNSLPVGINQLTYSYIPSNGDQVYMVMNSSMQCSSGNPATSNVVTMMVNSQLPASVSISPDQNNVCQGTPVTFTAIQVNGGIPTYQWNVNGVPVGTNQPTFSYLPASGDLVNVTMTSSLSCVSGNPAISNTVIMTVNPILPVSVTVMVDQNNICDGTSVTFTAFPVNGGTPSFQWYRNSIPVGVNQSTYSCIPSNGDVVYAIVTSNLSCITGNPATSNTVTMAVNPVMPAGVSISVNQNNICQGTSVTFTASPVNGGTPVYQWYKNSLPVGLNQAAYTFVPSNGDQVYVVMNSSLSCTSGSPATSNIVTMAVNTPLPAGVTISPDQNNICEGTPVVFTAIAVNGGTPSYQWQVNGNAAGLNNATFNYIPSNGDVVGVVMTSGLSCVTGNPATSNIVGMQVNPVQPVSVTISASQTEVCQGTQVTFTAVPVNGGTPVFQWFRNGLPVGLNLPAYSCIPEDGDLVYVEMSSSQTCISGSPATSNSVAMTVKPLVPLSVSISADKNDVCQGTAVTITATVMNGGNSVYQWYQNGTPAGTGLPVYSFVPSSGDQVYLVVTAGLACATGNPVSETLTMIVRSGAGNAGTITGSSSVCAGTGGVGFSVAPVSNADSYSWSLPAGAEIVSGQSSNSITVNFSFGATSGDVTVQGLNACGTGVVSPIFQVAVNPVPVTPVVTIQWPNLESSSAEGNQWYYQDTLIAGATGQTYNAVKPGWYWTVATSLGCSSDTSNHVYVDTTNPDILVPGILVYPVPNNGKFNVSITLLSQEMFNITIYNYLGKKMFEVPDFIVNGKYKQVIDLRPMAMGVYTIVFRCKDYTVVRKVLINRK